MTCTAASHQGAIKTFLASLLGSCHAGHLYSLSLRLRIHYVRHIFVYYNKHVSRSECFRCFETFWKSNYFSKVVGLSSNRKLSALLLSFLFILKKAFFPTSRHFHRHSLVSDLLAGSFRPELSTPHCVNPFTVSQINWERSIRMCFQLRMK